MYSQEINSNNQATRKRVKNRMTNETKRLEKELLELAAQLPEHAQAAVNGCLYGMIAVAKQVKSTT